MATFTIYKLHFNSPLHIGDKRDDYGISLHSISSDTFYAAITACLAKIGESIPSDGDLGFVQSSLFPYYQRTKDTECVYFLPAPKLMAMPMLSEKNLDMRKKVKKVNWLDVKHFENVLSGKPVFDESNNSVNSIKGKYLTDFAIDEKFMSSSVVQRVTVSRTGQENAEPFYMDRLSFKGYSGFYFMVDGDTSLLDKAMPLLAEDGIGTDRNVGHGNFSFEKLTLDIIIPESSDYAVSLSMFIPEDKSQLIKMTDGENVAYDFERRGGWITTPPYNMLRKNYIYAFVPSSVFRCDISSVEKVGKIVDLKPTLPDSMSVSHPVWRSGKTLLLPIKI